MADQPNVTDLAMKQCLLKKSVYKNSIKLDKEKIKEFIKKNEKIN